MTLMKNVNFTLSTLMPSNLIDVSAKNSTTITSNQGNDANERFFHNINELKEQVKEKMIKIFTSITATIWESRQNEGGIKVQNKFFQQALDFDDALDVAEATSEGVIK